VQESDELSEVRSHFDVLKHGRDARCVFQRYTYISSLFTSLPRLTAQI